jgi:hypothetical protein
MSMWNFSLWWCRQLLVSRCDLISGMPFNDDYDSPSSSRCRVIAQQAGFMFLCSINYRILSTNDQHFFMLFSVCSSVFYLLL